MTTIEYLKSLKKLDGIDWLGGARYKNMVISQHPAGYAAGFFWEVDGFGCAYDVIDELLSTGKCPRVRIHLMWKDQHDFNETDIKTCVQRVKEINPLVIKYPNVEFMISPACEHRMDLALATKFRNRVMKNANERCIYVNTPESSRFAIFDDAINELHHDHFVKTKGLNQFSFDGKECFDSIFTSYRKKAKKAGVITFFAWGFRCNGRWDEKDPTPRKDRTGWPEPKYCKSMVRLFGVKGKTSLPDKWLYKSHAENKNENLGREEKPVFVIPYKADKILLKAAGKEVYSFEYNGPYEHKPGFHSYREKDGPAIWGYEIADKVLQIKPTAICSVIVDKKKVGQINPVFREGSIS